MIKAVFLDRDGTLIDEPDTPTEAVASWEQFKLKSDLVSLVDLQKAGYVFFIISNQEAIDEGNLSIEFYEATNKRLVDELKQLGISIEKIYTCQHARAVNCLCRKSKRGLIDQALAEYDIDMPNSYIVGDRPTDVELGLLVGARTAYIESPKHKLSTNLQPDFTAHDLGEVVVHVLATN